jgi:hypothetical protein
MTEYNETINDDGFVEGTISRGEHMIRYHVEGKAIEDSKIQGLDILAEVRAAVVAELDNYAASSTTGSE